MGKTIAEKVFTRTSGGKDVKAGDFVTAKVDLHYNPDDGMAEVHHKVVEAGLPDGLPRVANPDILAVILGAHHGCHAKPKEAEAYKLSRELAERYGIKKLYEMNTGIAHVVVPEEGLARPGLFRMGFLQV